MQRSVTLLAFLLSSLAFSALALEPERSVSNHTVTSTHDPRVRLHVPEDAVYLGADRWILGGYDDCEMHLFAEPGSRGNVRQLYWIQFEAYVPERPELRHDYNSSRRIRWHGLDFYLDTWVEAARTPSEPDSDSGHMRALLARKQLHLPKDGMYVRLVHLPDAAMRHEMMIIYGEDLAPTGLTVAQLDKQGDRRDAWTAVEKALIDRAMHRVTLSP